VTAADRLLLVIDDDPTRIESIAHAVRTAAPDAEVRVFDTTTHDALPALLAVTDAVREPGTTVVLIRADPAGWTTATVLAALRRADQHGQVDAVVIAEGPPERLPVLITDFHGLRLLPPHRDTPAAIAAVLMANTADLPR
jgi:CheY-like chemotaxis protein